MIDLEAAKKLAAVWREGGMHPDNGHEVEQRTGRTLDGVEHDGGNSQ